MRSPIPPVAGANALVAVLSLALLWGLNWPAVKIVLSWWSPWALRSVGLGVGGLLLFGLAIARRETLRIAPGQRLRLVISSLLSIVGFNLGTAFAQMAGSTSRAAIVTYSMPVWVVLIAWLMIGEKPDRTRQVAVLLGVLGLALLGIPLVHVDDSPAGPLFALAAGLSWAIGTVFVKRYPISASAMVSTAWQLAIGATVSLTGWMLWRAPAQPDVLAAYPPTWFWIALAFHVVLATALAYLIWFNVVARMPAGVASMGTLLVPVVGVGGAMLLLGERPSASDLGGFVLITAAAALALLAPRAASTNEQGGEEY